ncbi:MAG: mandelate racemase [Boseongicola sp. SB0665_bin_10]|nr:mandelate racemase [Boseongicola sp. SB0665_bin_10]
MKISAVRLWHLPLKSHQAYHMADGKTCDTVETVILALDTDAGITGWGEVCPIPHYLPAYARGVQPAITELAPTLLGCDPIGPDAVISKADAWLQGHVYAKSAIDIALWDLTARVADLPLYRVLGGRQTDSMPLYHSITCIAPDEMARIAREAKAQGIGQFQVKLGASGGWQTDVERLTAVREAVGPGPLVYGDWNTGATSLEATRVGRAVRDLDIMLEQPCRTLAECARVRDATGLPMKLDEAAHDTETLLEGHARACMDAVALKLSKFGGISACRSARDLCLHLGSKMCIEDTWGSDIATAALLHLAATTPPSRLLNTCDLSGYVGPRLDPNAPSREGGCIAPPEGPGLGIDPDLDILGDPDLTLE